MVTDYRKLWYDDKAIANIFSLNNLVNKYRVTYDSHQDYSLTVHADIVIIKFRINKQGLYVFKPTYTTANSNVVTKVEKNMVGFTSRQIERAKLAIKIYINVGLPTVNNLNHLVSTNMVSNFPISVADIINAENIYQTSTEILKGMSSRRKPRPVIKDDI